MILIAISRISPRVRVKVSVSTLLGLATVGYSWMYFAPKPPNGGSKMQKCKVAIFVQNLKNNV